MGLRRLNRLDGLALEFTRIGKAKDLKKTPSPRAFCVLYFPNLNIARIRIAPSASVIGFSAHTPWLQINPRGPVPINRHTIGRTS